MGRQSCINGRQPVLLLPHHLQVLSSSILLLPSRFSASNPRSLSCWCLDPLCSPSGKLVQIEHALMAVGSGQTSLGIKGNHSAYGVGVVPSEFFCNWLACLCFLSCDFEVSCWYSFLFTLCVLMILGDRSLCNYLRNLLMSWKKFGISSPKMR